MTTSNKTIDWYNDHADEFTAHVSVPDNSPYHAYYEKPAMYSELPDLTGKPVLSLGCGSGEDSQHLKDMGAKRSVGIDISEKLIKIAKDKHPECEFSVMDMEKLDFEDEIFDVVFSSLAMHHLLDGMDKVLGEVYRVLKPTGLLLFSDGHPIDTAMEVLQSNDNAETKLLGVKRDTVKNINKVYGDYLTPRVQDGKSMEVEYFHQPISNIVNSIINAGFSLDKIVEPKPTEGFKKVSTEQYERLMLIPEFIIYKARKPIILE